MKTDAEDDVERGRQRRPVGEVLAALDGVKEDRGGDEPQGDIEPADAVAIALGERKHQEAQHQHEGDVGVAQRLGGDDGKIGKRPGAGDRRVEMEQAHDDRDGGHRRTGPAGEPVGDALLGLHEGLGLAQLLLRNALRPGRRAGRHVLGHSFPLAGAPLRLPIEGEASTSAGGRNTRDLGRTPSPSPLRGEGARCGWEEVGGRSQPHAVPSPPLPSAACAAASRAMGTRNGEHDT